jgi:hypothetical protein
MERLEIGLEHLKGIKVLFGVVVWMLMLCALLLLLLISQRMLSSLFSFLSVCLVIRRVSVVYSSKCYDFNKLVLYIAQSVTISIN